MALHAWTERTATVNSNRYSSIEQVNMIALVADMCTNRDIGWCILPPLPFICQSLPWMRFSIELMVCMEKEGRPPGWNAARTPEFAARVSVSKSE